MKIQVVGPGCTKCRKLAENTLDAVRELELDAEVVKVDDIREIMRMGVMSTPALAVDGHVLSVGRVLNVKEIKQMIGG